MRLWRSFAVISGVVGVGRRVLGRSRAAQGSCAGVVRLAWAASGSAARVRRVRIALGRSIVSIGLGWDGTADPPLTGGHGLWFRNEAYRDAGGTGLRKGTEGPRSRSLLVARSGILLGEDPLRKIEPLLRLGELGPKVVDVERELFALLDLPFPESGTEPLGPEGADDTEDGVDRRVGGFRRGPGHPGSGHVHQRQDQRDRVPDLRLEGHRPLRVIRAWIPRSSRSPPPPSPPPPRSASHRPGCSRWH